MLRKLLLIFSVFLLLAPNGWALQLPQTGQTLCYTAAGIPTACAGTGQDAEHLMGVEWPAPRFVDNADGTLTDTLTGLMWLKDANCMKTTHPSNGGATTGLVDLAGALAFIDTINGADMGCSAGYSDWVLPNINEMKSLVNFENVNQIPWLTGLGFTNLEPKYITSSRALYEADLYFFTNPVGADQEWYIPGAVLPVRRQAPGSVALLKTGLVDVSIPGTDGATQRGEIPPVPRFTTHGDGTVSDNLTGLMWLQDADCFPIDTPTPNATISQFNSRTVDDNCLGGPNPHRDWRLPNINELGSLIDYSVETDTFLVQTPGPFNLNGLSKNYATGTRVPGSPAFMSIDFGLGTLSSSQTGLVWPVRGGFFAPEIAVTPLSLNFGTVSQGSSTPLGLTITNAGNADLHLVDLNISGVDSLDFSLNLGTCADYLLTPAESCVLTISLASASTGSKTASIDIASDDPNTPVFQGALSGNVIAPDTQAPTTSANFSAGSYASPISVSLTCSDNQSGCANTWYTTDGSVPTTASTLYTAPISVSSTIDLRFFSVDQNSNTELPRSVKYTIVDPAACPTLVALGDQFGPDLNDLGEVVWSAYTAVTGNDQLFSSTRGQLTFGPDSAEEPSINNHGDMAWVQAGGEIVFQLAAASSPVFIDFGNSPVILNSGDVYYLKNYEVYSQTLGQLTFSGTVKYSLDVNNNGEMVWIEFDGTNEKLFHLPASGSTPVEIASSNALLDFPSIRDNGEIVWSEEIGGQIKLISSTKGDLTVNGCLPQGDYWEPAVDNQGGLVFYLFDLVDGSASGLYKFSSVGGGALTANFSFDSVQNPGSGSISYCDTVSLNGALSTAASGRSIVAWRWDLDNNGSFETNGVNTTFLPVASGTTTVVLQVEDDLGALATKSRDIALNNAAPSAIAGGPYSFTAGENLLLGGSGNDSDGCNTGLTYAWDLNGDATYDLSGANPVLTEAQLESLGLGEGVHVISLDVTDDQLSTTRSNTSLTILKRNVALASNGAVASASSTLKYAGFHVDAINNGDRTGAVWGGGGGWNDDTLDSFPDWVQINFAGTNLLNEIRVVTLQDNYIAPVDPNAALSFVNHGITDFDVQYWNGSDWVTVPGGSVTGNDRVLRTFVFTTIATDRIRVQINSALNSYSRIVELEAYASAKSPTVSLVSPTNGQIFTTPAAITLSATAASTGNSLDHVEFYDGVNLIGSDNTLPYELIWNNPASGIHSLRAVSFDSLGNVATSGTVTIDVQNGLPRINVASSANGGVASSSSGHSFTLPVASVNDDDRKAVNWGAGAGWSDNTPGIYPDWVQINFSATRAIDEINVVTLQDNFAAAQEPTTGMLFTKYGIVDFEVQYWTGLAWVNVPGGGVSGNEQVLRNFIFNPIITDRIRVLVSNARASYSRIVEIEAYSSFQAPTISLVNPAQGQVLVAPSTLNLSVSTSVDASLTVARVDYYSGSNLLGSSITSPYDFNWSTPAVGAHPLSARVVDSEGAVATSSVINIEVQSGLSRVNVASASEGALASSSTSYNSKFAASAVNNDDRTGSTWGAGGGWNDATSGVYPDWVQIDFANARTINEINVITLQDALGGSVSPTAMMTFSKYGIVDFDVQYWNGSAWVTVPNGNITGNNKILRSISFTPVSTDKIRVVVNSAKGGYSRIVEIEAFAVSQPPIVSLNNPTEGQVFVAPVDINLNATATPDAGQSIDRVEFYDGQNLLGTDFTAPYTLVWNSPSFGFHSLSAVAYDNHGWSTTTTAVDIEVQSGVARVNVAAAVSGAMVSASSTYNTNFDVYSVINGDRTGANWGSQAGWNDATASTYPDWVQVDFAGSQTINEVSVITLQDNYASPIEPFAGLSFTKYGVTDFSVSYWNGSAWTVVPNGMIVRNDQVWRKINFTPVNTTRIRVEVTGAKAGYSRIVEIEALTP